MTAHLRIRELLADPVLISRDSARSIGIRLGELLRDAAANGTVRGSVGAVVDFDGVATCAPSCADEFVFVFKELVGAGVNAGIPSLVIMNPPTRLSNMLRAIGRGQGMTVEEQPDGSWLLTDSGWDGG
ncbi:MAG: hypothetical protein HOP29_06595 [Phycisphaerales bacterium]|nr:hypothetical protein [Phycisphaerales bacterium]